MRSGEQGVPTLEAWLCKNVPAGQVVAVDPFTISAASALELSTLLEKTSVSLAALDMYDHAITVSREMIP
jgi:hypothetical protein